MSPRRDLLNLLLAAQAGVASRSQLMKIGYEPDQIRYRVRSGDWATTRVGVVRLAGAPVTWEGELVASVLALRDRAVASHGTAARLHQFRGRWDERIEFTAVAGRRISADGQTLHRTRSLDLIDLATFRREVSVDRRLKDLDVVKEVRVTSPTRTIIDLAARSTSTQLGDLVDDAASRGRTTVEFVAQRLGELRRRGLPGTRELSEVFLDAGGHSWLERRVLRLVREAGLPRPRTQVVFKRDGTTVARVDFLFDGTNLIVEVSGRRGHSSDADRATDARRRNELQRQGYVVVEFVTTQVIDDPVDLVATLRRHLARTLAG